MKLYRTKTGVLLETGGAYYRVPCENWDDLINNDNIFQDLKQAIPTFSSVGNGAREIEDGLLIPLQSQEIWASGVTYLRSKQGRQEESGATGGADFYQRIYEAERPELFFKANAARTSASGENIRIRKDSTWDVPEPELTLVMTASSKIIGYTIGNDVSSRSIEGENPLYLPQAKTYDGCAAVGPCILLTEAPLDPQTQIHLNIERAGTSIFSDSIAINQITRKFTDLAEFLYRECSFPYGALLMTGTGIVPDSGFTLKSGDVVSIEIDGIGRLKNAVA
ncbi:MAG: 2-hydroxyhepta-2,4-diene-1,7-dioate isomerase [Robiginitomaculum sp.]|nr:MAG: 2-hydroxyhepta-2,4-diene-1,7-dioate isomerase [Robiginitomaculum sp.]